MAAVAEVDDEFVVRVEYGDTGFEIRDEQVPVALVEVARGTHLVGHKEICRPSSVKN